jgi:transglutaminase-like putative cysteine protease
VLTQQMPQQKKLLLCWAAIQFSLLLLLQQAFASWVIAIFALLLLYRLLSVFQAKAPVSLKLVNLLAGIIAITFFLQLRQAGVLHFMLQILLLAATARLLALQHLYEARQLVWVHYFLIACCFILHQDMLIALLIFLVFAANLYSHYRLFSSSVNQVNWPQTGRSLLIILPLWLAMFLLFPRLPPFWQIPNANIASTGLSDTLDPGSIEQLVQDDSLAFRVEFDGELPPRQQLYWRARLYEDFDGRRWQVNTLRQNASRQRAANDAAVSKDSSLSYRIIAEASQQTGLFALATPITSSSNVFISPSGLLNSSKPVSQRLSYQVSGSLVPVMLVSEQEQQLNLRTAPGNPQTRQFAYQLKQQYPQNHALVQALAEHFRQQAFYYSLTPPPLASNSIDAFLFDSRTGFCSHYASASAVILRHAGIAARVVGGYQGGNWHPQQGYLSVRQREAHAWVEYLDNGVWQPFDPTAAVAPERILNSLDSALPEDQRALLDPGWRQLALLQNARQQLMHLDYYWSVWVLGFNENSQQQLWRNLYRHLPAIAYAVAALFSIIIVLLLYYRLTRSSTDNTPAATKQLYRYLGKVLATKPPSLSVSAFLLQCAKRYPAHNAYLKQLTAIYEQALYKEDIEALNQLKQLLKCHKAELGRLRRAIKNT